jgi:hypothetical protein
MYLAYGLPSFFPVGDPTVDFVYTQRISKNEFSK